MNNTNSMDYRIDNKLSRTRRIQNIFLSDKHAVYDVEKMAQTYTKIYNEPITNPVVSNIIRRLYYKGKLIRTDSEQDSGYFYTVLNKPELDKIYRNYLLPYSFDNSEELIKLILQNKFNFLRTNEKLNLSSLVQLNLIKRHGIHFFNTNKVLKFLAINIGFLMCDGHLKKDFRQCIYYIYEKEDAQAFVNYFNSLFPEINLSITQRDCYVVSLCSKDFATIFNKLGAPSGRKVFAPFIVPNWIYHGNNSIKKSFLSTVYGNEGSKPQDNKYRIGFVLSKNKVHIPNLLYFLNQIRTMLFHFGISSSFIQLRKQKGRQFCGRFYIRGKENLTKFYNILEFSYASEKQRVLEALLKKQ